LETSRITEDGIIYSYLAAKRLGIDYDMRKRVYDDVKGLTLADLSKFHETMFSGKPYAYCIVGSKDRMKQEDLAKYGAVKELDLETLFGY